MARPPNADGQRTRQAILDAALALFAEKGYFGTSLRDVARAVGVRESALYNYFDGKEALFEALLTAESADRIEHFAAILEAPISDGRDVLERLAEFVLDRFVQPRQQQLFRILMSDGMRLARDGRINLLERMQNSRPRLEEIMQRLIDEGCLRDVDPELLVMQFFGPLLFWRQLHAIGAKRAVIRNRRAFARAHVDHFLTGAAAEPGASAARLRRVRSA
jgi:TetR/AcrR family transcriptional regulator, biofilm operon repressor